MRKLEQNILKKVYQFEAKRTLAEIVFKSVTLIFLSLAVFIFGSVFLEILKEQKTFDLLKVFSEDFEVIRKYCLENLSLFFFELPKVLLIILLIFTFLFIFLTLTMIKNFNTLKNRVKSLLKFLRKKI